MRATDDVLPASEWHAFTTAESTEEFCQAWLALLCSQLDGVHAGAVLLESEQLHTFIPVAVWPKASGDLARLGKVAERALKERRGIVEWIDESGELVHIGYHLYVAQRIVGAVALEIEAIDESKISPVLRQIHWSIAWIRELFHRNEHKAQENKASRIGSVMETVATALRPIKLQQTLFELTNHIARTLQCSRVAIGLTEGHAVHVKALSDAAWFEKNTGLVRAYAAAMDEAFDARIKVSYVSEVGQNQNKGATDSEIHGSAAVHGTPHERLAIETGAKHFMSYPLLLGVDCVGVMTLERLSDLPFKEEDIEWIDAFSALLPSIIDQKRQGERGYWQRLQDDGRTLFSKLFGPRHLIWKFGTALLVFIVMALIIVQIDYRVAAKTVIEGEVQRVAAAPFEGFIAASYVRAGDTVHEGQVLCELDDRDLKIERARWGSEREQHDKKLREALANRDLVSMQVVGAQLKQAEAQLALATERMQRAKITAPFDGVIVSGDLSQQIGSPVELGKKLFEIAPLSSYRVILQVDEREIRHLGTGQAGQLLISGIAGDPIPFQVSKITPVATAQEGRNFFRVEAQLHQGSKASSQLRPGMEGIGKVNVGSHSVWWIVSHSFTDWLRLTLWSWIP